MKYQYGIILAVGLWSALWHAGIVYAQCSICTRTAQQLGPKAAAGLNSGIIYLMALPLILVGIMIWYVRKKIK